MSDALAPPHAEGEANMGTSGQTGDQGRLIDGDTAMRKDEPEPQGWGKKYEDR